MALAFAEEFKIVGREIDDEQLSAGFENARCLGDHVFRLFQIVQHLVNDYQVGAIILEWCVGDIALADAGIAHVCAVEIGPRDRQHVMRQVQAFRVLCMRSEKGQHAASAGAQVDQTFKSAIADLMQDRGIDIGFRIMERAQPIPRLGDIGKVGFGGDRALAAHILERRRVLSKRGGGQIEFGEQGIQNPTGPVFRPRAIEHPGPFRQPLDQAAIGQGLQMMRQTRLTLIQNLDQLTHGQIAAPQERENAQSRWLAGRLQGVNQSVRI